MPEFPLPVGALEGEAKGALAKFPLADVPGDPKHPARLLLKLQATIAGCDWMLTRWMNSGFDSKTAARGLWRTCGRWCGCWVRPGSK